MSRRDLSEKREVMSTTIQIGQGTLEYQLREKPNSPTLVFLHGLGANQTQFDKQIDFFAHAYQLLTLNVRGHGRSHSSEPFSLAGCAQDLITLLDALAVEQFHFVGNSMGGNIGYELLRLHEERLLSMTTFGTTAVLHTPTSTTKLLTFVYKLLPTSLIALLASSAGQTTDSKQTIKRMMGEIQKESLLEIVPVLAQFDYLPVIAASHTPFMIIRGSKDRDINKVLPSTVAALEKRGDFRLVELADVGHFANLDDPARFNEVLADFLAHGRG